MTNECKVSSNVPAGSCYRPYGGMFDGTGYDVNNPTGRQAASLFSGLNWNYGNMDCSPYDTDYMFSLPTTGYYGMGCPMGLNGMMGGMIPFTGSATSNPADYLKQMQEYQQAMTDLNVQQQKNNRNAELRVNASMESVQNAVATLQDKVNRNEQDQIVGAFNNLVEKVHLAYGDASDTELKNRAVAIYKNQTGNSLAEDIRKNGNGSFTQGVLQTITFGLDDHKSAEDIVSDINGQPVASWEKTKQNTGRVVGGIGLGAIAGVMAKMLKFVNIKNVKWQKAGVVGVVAGLAAMAYSFFSGKATT